MTRDVGCYYQLKIANLIAMVMVATLGLVIASRDEERRLYLLSMIWPSCLFFVTGINQHAVFHILSLALGAHAIAQRRPFRTMLLALPLVLVDRSAVTLIGFLGIWGSLQFRARWTPVILVMLVFLVQAVPLMLPFLPQVISGGDAAAIAESLAAQRDSPFFSLALFALSFVYLGGTSTIYGIGLDYVVFAFAISALVYRNRRSLDMWSVIGAFLMTYLIVLSVVPTIQSFRYYPFLLPALLHVLMPKKSERTWYVAYCSAMIPIYIAQGLIIANA